MKRGLARACCRSPPFHHGAGKKSSEGRESAAAGLNGKGMKTGCELPGQQRVDLPVGRHTAFTGEGRRNDSNGIMGFPLGAGTRMAGVLAGIVDHFEEGGL